MSSRSFKPASYFASAAAAQQQKAPRSPRPSFVRTASTSASTSNVAASMKNEDMFFSSFRPLNTGGDMREADREEAEVAGERKAACCGGGSPRRDPSGGNNSPGPTSKPEGSPARKKSSPIAIEVPARNAPVAYTPLTGRGELIGGYFPDHEGGNSKPHGFGYHSRSGTSTPGSPSSMSASSSRSSPGSDFMPRGPASVLSPIANSNSNSNSPSPTFPIVDALGIPLGKYYPSNYKPPVTAVSPNPSVAPTSAPPTSLSIPQFAHFKNKKTPGHERDSSDVKRKLQQYQRDMIAQARMASASASASSSAVPTSLTMPKPTGPKLVPCGSPGPITPLELEESDGYLTAGARAKRNNPIASGLENEKQLAQATVSAEN